MVLLTMTAAMVDALEQLGSLEDRVMQELQDATGEPSLSEPSIGKPVSHGQVIGIYKQIKNIGDASYHLDTLLRGSRVYVPPPPPKPEPTSEYKALMARLRREEEARAYERMVNPLPPRETFSQRFPTASAAYAFSSTVAYESSKSITGDDDDITYTDVNRQVTVIINVLISIVACAAALWVAARWWDTPARLALSMSGSLLVGAAEVVVYTGYLRRLGEAKGNEAAVKEVKEIVKTWVIGEEEDWAKMENIQEAAPADKKAQSTRQRRKQQKEPPS